MVQRTRDGTAVTLWLAAPCGVLAGIGGFTHGVGEVLQGASSPAGVIFDSWTDEPMATNLGGEPAMTLVPNLLLTGILTMLASLAVIAWSAAWTGHRWYGRVLLLLSVVMLLVGGGFAPPLIGMLAAAAAMAGDRRRVPAAAPGRLVRSLSVLWPLLRWVVLLDVAFLAVGSVVLAAWFDVNAPDVFVIALFVAVAGIPVATLAGATRNVTDAELRTSPHLIRPGRLY